MNESFSIGRLFGIELRVHVLFVYMSVALIAMGAMSANGSALTTAAFLAMLVTLVLLHELGHARVAQHFGVEVIDIVLWPLGGMARMTQLPEDPKVEGWVAVAGPLVNLVLAALGALALLATQGIEWIHPIEGQLIGVRSVLALFVIANLLLGLFNLLPAFPMDGGRLLRAFLARKRPWLEATERAVQVSRVLAMTMVVGSFFIRPFNCMLPLIGIYVLWEGARELWATRMRHAVGAGPFGVPGAGPGQGAAGGIDLQSLFRMAREQHARRQGRPSQPSEPSEPPEDLGPHGPEAEPPTGADGGGGFSDEEVRRLEQFRGRLPRRSQDES